MLEKLKKYLHDYSKEIGEQPQQESDKNIRALWERNAELAIKIYGILNVRYMSLYRIEDIPEQYRESYKDRANRVFDNMQLMVHAEHCSIDHPSDIVATRDYSLDVLKSIFLENYNPPKEIEDTLKHLLTLHFLFSHLMPKNPDLSHIISLRAGCALALLCSSALMKSSIADEVGQKGYRSTRQGKAKEKERADMLSLITDACTRVKNATGFRKDKFRTKTGEDRYYCWAESIQGKFKKDEDLRNRLEEIRINKKVNKNGTKIPIDRTIIYYLKKIDL